MNLPRCDRRIKNRHLLYTLIRCRYYRLFLRNHRTPELKVLVEQGRTFDLYNPIIRIRCLPCAYIAPERPCVPRFHVQLDVSSRYTDENVLHVDECVQFNFPVVTRWAARSARKADRAEHRFVIYLKLFIRSQAVIEKLNVWALVIQIPSESLLPQENQLGIVRYVLLLESLIKIQSFQHSHWIDELDYMIGGHLIWLSQE